MNIVIGCIGQNALQDFNFLKKIAEQYVKSDLSLHIDCSPDGKCCFALDQPSGFFPLEKPFFKPKNKYLCMLQGYFWYRSHFPESGHMAKSSIIKAAQDFIRNGRLVLSESDGGLYNYFLYNENHQKLYITSDFSGIFPLYYTEYNSSFYFSSHSRVLAKAFEKVYDPVSIIQRMAFHYTIGKRTLFEDIWRLNPGETLIYSLDSQNLEINQPTFIYSAVTPYKNDNEAVEALYHDYLKGINELNRYQKTRGIMMSGGFDTRLVTHGYFIKNNPIIGLTLGDENNYEVKIAKKLSRKIKSAHQIHTPQPGIQLTPQKIEYLIKSIENINFVHDDIGVTILKQLGAETVSTGYGGETFFGGQGYTFYGKSLNSKKRFQLALTRSLSLPINFYDPYEQNQFNQVQNLITNFHERQMASKKPWFVPNFYQQFEDELIESLTLEIRNELSRYLVSNPGTIQQLLERFWLEHHVLKEFGKKELTLAQHLPLVQPTLHHSFMVRCSNLPPNRKIDHGIYLKLVKKYLGKLAQLPTSNIPLPLIIPTPILWISRAIRANYDNRQVKNQFDKKGKNKISRHGWSNFEEWFREGDFLSHAIDYINSDLFSEVYLNRKVKQWLNWEERIYSGQDLLNLITISQLLK